MPSPTPEQSKDGTTWLSWPPNDSPLTTVLYACLNLWPHSPHLTAEFPGNGLWTKRFFPWVYTGSPTSMPRTLLLSLQVKKFLSEHRGSNRMLSAPKPGPGGTETDEPRGTTGSHDSIASEMLNKLNLKEAPSCVPKKCTNLPERIRTQGDKVQPSRRAGIPSASTAPSPQTPETSPFRNHTPSPKLAWTPGPGPKGNQVRPWQN